MAQEMGVPFLGSLPLDPRIGEWAGSGTGLLQARAGLYNLLYIYITSLLKCSFKSNNNNVTILCYPKIHCIFSVGKKYAFINIYVYLYDIQPNIFTYQ